MLTVKTGLKGIHYTISICRIHTSGKYSNQIDVQESKCQTVEGLSPHITSIEHRVRTLYPDKAEFIHCRPLVFIVVVFIMVKVILTEMHVGVLFMKFFFVTECHNYDQLALGIQKFSQI